MDAISAVITILSSDTVPGGVVSLVGIDPTIGTPAIYGGQLPEHYNPEVSTTAEPAGDGPAITLVVKGGDTHAEMPMQDVDVQLQVWAGINANYNARQIYNRCFQVLHRLTGQNMGGAGLVHAILATVPGSDLVDPDTGWATIVSAFHVKISDTGAYPVNVQITPTETAAQYTDAAIAAENFVEDGGNFS